MGGGGGFLPSCHCMWFGSESALLPRCSELFIVTHPEQKKIDSIRLNFTLKGKCHLYKVWQVLNCWIAMDVKNVSWTFEGPTTPLGPCERSVSSVPSHPLTSWETSGQAQKAWSGLSPTRNPVHLGLWGLSFPSVESQSELGLWWVPGHTQSPSSLGPKIRIQTHWSPKNASWEVQKTLKKKSHMDPGS